MSFKHFSNDVNALVTAALRAATYTNPSLTFDQTHKIVSLRDDDNGDGAASQQPTVALVSGGGSGHEPSFAGFVGRGFLTAAVAGSVFASPSAEQVFQAIRRLGGGEQGRRQQQRRSVLVIIMNYTGDVLHFGMAVERARAAGIETELLVVGDDVGVGRKRSGRIGRRGLAGTVLVQKIAGAAAAQGVSLQEIHKIASLAAQNTATVGASLAHVHVPGRDITPDELGDEIEIGMGIHNEEGFGRVKTTLPGLVATMLQQLLDQSDTDRAYIEVKPRQENNDNTNNSNEEVIVMINNLGGVSALELGAITAEVVDQLAATYRIRPARLLSGTYMSSLNGMGFSITLLKVVDRAFLTFIDAPADAAGWSPAVQPENWEHTIDASEAEAKHVSPGNDDEEASIPSNLTLDGLATISKLQAALSGLIAAEPEVTKYDTLVGDGDCGLCLKTGAEAVLKHISAAEIAGSTPEQKIDAVHFVRYIARVIESSMDGTSGALYAIFINALASGLQAQAQAQEQQHRAGHVQSQATPSQAIAATPRIWAEALRAALDSLAKYTPAQPGDRTVVDTLAPFVSVLAETLDIKRAVEAAKKGCDATKGMEASLGRSVYVNAEGWSACPDPGAYGLVKLLEGFLVE